RGDIAESAEDGSRWALPSGDEKRERGFQTDHADQAGSLRAGGAISPPHRQRLWGCGWRGVPRECMALDPESGSPRSLSFLRVLPTNLLTRPCIAEPNASGSESRDSDPDAGLTHSRT